MYENPCRCKAPIYSVQANRQNESVGEVAYCDGVSGCIGYSLYKEAPVVAQYSCQQKLFRFVVFISPSRHKLVKYLKIDHGCFPSANPPGSSSSTSVSIHLNSKYNAFRRLTRRTERMFTSRDIKSVRFSYP